MGWIKFPDNRPVDFKAIAFFSDAFPPSLFNYIGIEAGWVPTISLTTYFLREPTSKSIKMHQALEVTILNKIK